MSAIVYFAVVEKGDCQKKKKVSDVHTTFIPSALDDVERKNSSRDAINDYDVTGASSSRVGAVTTSSITYTS